MIRLRCSQVGKIMTAPKEKGQILSVGAKTYIRELAAQEIFGIDFSVSSKAMEKGIECEQAGIDLLNSVKGLWLEKNTERRTDDYITGECDLFDSETKEGRDIKCSWSAATFPILPSDCADAVYEWQMRAYMRLWDAAKWHVDYVLVDTPERLIGYEPAVMHRVGHIPDRMRVTTWTIEREVEKEALMLEKVKAARMYYAEVLAEFEKAHA